MGSTAGGTYADFDWGDEPTGLDSVEILLEWNATDLLDTELYVRATLLSEVDHFLQPSAEGVSPLTIRAAFTQGLEPVDEPRIYFQSAHHEDRPASASMTLLPQEVRVTVTEHYRSCTRQA
ncbi:MAG: hypothetical protein ACYC2H_04080 [Thermoplasmatota archaeon]